MVKQPDVPFFSVVALSQCDPIMVRVLVCVFHSPVTGEFSLMHYTIYIHTVLTCTVAGSTSGNT